MTSKYTKTLKSLIFFKTFESTRYYSNGKTKIGMGYPIQSSATDILFRFM